MKEKKTSNTISRRKALSLTGLSTGALALGGLTACTDKSSTPVTTRKRIPFDPSDVRQSTMAFLKLSGSLGNETVRMWFTGKAYAYFPGEPVVPLYNLDGFYLSEYEALDDGSHKATRYEVTIKRDLETGELLETWNNPFTNRTDTVVNNVGGPQYKIYNDWGFGRPDTVRTADNPLILEWNIVGDQVWCTWDLFIRFKNPLQPNQFPLESSGEMLNLVNLSNYKGSLSDIEDPDVLNTSGELIWNAVSGWQPWMRMGQKPGTIIYKAIGVKVDSFKDIPTQIYDAAEKAFPGHLSEQRPWQEGSYQWFDHKGAEPVKWEDLVE